MEARLLEPLAIANVDLETRMRRAFACAALAVPVLTGLAVLISGFGIAWDFLNYHYYDAYAVFHDRSHDIAPAGLHTFFNPTAEIPFYLGATYLPMPLFGFLFGFVSGLNFPLVFFLARKLLRGPYGSLLAFLCAAFGCSSANFAVELASVNHDNLASLFFLAGLLALVHALQAQRAWIPAALAGLVIGAGVGLKLTLAPFLVATGVFLPLLFRDRLPLKPMLATLAIFAVAALAGVLATSGWWMLHSWTAYGNPLFPMFNTFFQSPYAAPLSYADHRFVPKTLWQEIAYPLFFSFDFHQAGINKPLHDWRYLAAYIGFLAATAALLIRRPGPAKDAGLMNTNVAWFLIALAALSYILWQIAFGVSRYLMALDLILPLVALAWMHLLRWTSIRAIAVWTVSFILLALTASHPWHGEHRWTADLMSVSAPAVTANAMVVIAGTAPMSNLVTGFSPAVSFVRVSLHDGFVPAASGGITGLDSPALLARQARQAVAAHHGNLYVLFGHIPKKEQQEQAIVLETLKGLGLRIAAGSCAPVKPALHYVRQTFELCGLERR